MKTVTPVQVLAVMLAFGPSVKVRLNQVCFRLGVPSEFADEKAVKGERANSNGGSMQVFHALEELWKRGLVSRYRKGEHGAYDYSLLPEALEKMYEGYSTTLLADV